MLQIKQMEKNVTDAGLICISCINHEFVFFICVQIENYTWSVYTHFPTQLHISRFDCLYFWLFSSPVCSCSLLHCFVYIADEPQRLNCDASVKDWVEHVKINNNTPISLLFSKPAFLWGPSLWGPRVRTTWVSLQCGLLLLSLKAHT